MSKIRRENISLRRVVSVTDVRHHDLTAEPINPDTAIVRLEASLSSPVFDLRSVPVVATTLAIVLIALYNLADRCGINDETQVGVSWKKVVSEQQYWRILVAHYFHFSRVQFMINVTSLMALGRYLEKKFRPIPMLLLILFLGSLSNVIHMLLCTYVCDRPDDHFTAGFSHAIFSLKMVLVLSKDAGKRRGPSLLLGVLPVYLGSFAPWEPLFESVLSDVLVKGKHFPTHVSGVIAGLCFPLIDYFFHDVIQPPTEASLSFSASSGSQGQVNRQPSRSSSEQQLGRVMRLLKEDESRIQLFHDIPSNTDCVMLFSRRHPMKETSVHHQYASKSDSFLVVRGN